MRAILLIAFSVSILIAKPLLLQGKNLEIIVVTGERNFDSVSFFAMFDQLEGIKYTNIQHPDIRNMLGTDKMPHFDAIVFYDMPTNIQLSTEQKVNFKAFFKSGAPVVFMHHSILSYQTWDEFRLIIGGRYYENETEVDGKIYKSGYKHEVEYEIKIADNNHPITFGMTDFTITDEVYNNYFVSPGVSPLLLTSHSESGSIIGWINQYGSSSIVYLLNGHDYKAFNDTNFRQILLNSIRWVAETNQ